MNRGGTTQCPAVRLETETVRRTVFRWAERGAKAAALYHRAKLRGARHLRALEGRPALLVGNHGLWGYETPVFFHLVHRACGRYPLGLAERGFFRIPVVKTVLPWLGGVEGTRDAAREVLGRGELVVCYPGGAWETFKSHADRYRLRWEHTVGFCRLAAELGVPVVPFAGQGVDDTFYMSRNPRLSIPSVLGSGEKYRMPLVLGLGPLPRPTPLRFSVAAPVDPPRAGASDAELERFRDGIADTVRTLLEEASDA